MSDTKDCKFCNRRGLPLLPLRMAYVPNGIDNLPQGMSGAVKTPMQSGKYMLRSITEGFVYTYDKRAHVGWQCFAATPDGKFREVMIADEARPTTAPKFQCATQGHGSAASLISVTDALDGQEVWVGYFRTWLTKSARKTLAADDKLRKIAMVQINPRSLVTGGGAADKSRLSGGRDRSVSCESRFGVQGPCLGWQALCLHMGGRL